VVSRGEAVTQQVFRGFWGGLYRTVCNLNENRRTFDVHGHEVTLMADLIFVAVTVAFFVVSIGYVAGCERLR
jgi:hypothetical protein